MRNVNIARGTLIAILLLTPVLALAANPKLAPDLANSRRAQQFL
jgi:hypothetical protein